MAGFRLLASCLGSLVIGVFGMNDTEKLAYLGKGPMVMYAVLDRIVEEQHAVFLAEKNQVVRVVTMYLVPDSSVTGDWFRLYVIENKVESIDRYEQWTCE